MLRRRDCSVTAHFTVDLRGLSHNPKKGSWNRSDDGMDAGGRATQEQLPRALKMLKMEDFSLNFGKAVATPTVTSAGMREGRATHDRMDAGGRAAPGAAAEEQLPSQNLTKKYSTFSILSVHSRYQLRFLG